MTAGPALTVGVNLLWCVPDAVGGSEEYLTRQLRGLHDVEPRIALRLAVLPGFSAAHPELAGVAQLVAPVDGHRRGRRILVEATWLPSRLDGVDVVHHGGGTVPPRSPRPVVVTIHDLQYLTHPGYFTPHKLRYLRLAVPRAVRRAAVVAVPSEYVRATVVDACRAEPDRVVVVPHGVDRPAVVTDEATLRARYDLGRGPFVVYPAVTHPHKRHRFLLDVLDRAGGRWADPDLRLVLLGGAGAAERDITAALARPGLRARVRRPGRVPATDRDGLIAAAEALVFPSEYEGFGAPVLEALALGTPVVCSDAAAVREVVADAAVVCPLDPDAWAGALDEVAARRAALVAAGHRRAAAFGIAASGRALAAAYRLAAGSPR